MSDLFVIHLSRFIPPFISSFIIHACLSSRLLGSTVPPIDYLDPSSIVPSQVDRLPSDCPSSAHTIDLVAHLLIAMFTLNNLPEPLSSA